MVVVGMALAGRGWEQITEDAEERREHRVFWLVFCWTMKTLVAGTVFVLAVGVACGQAAPAAAANRAVVLHAAHLVDVAGGALVSPGEVLVVGDRIVAAGQHVERPAGAAVIDLGERTLMPGLIDAHVHLFLHPGAEDMQTVQESVPQRVILAEIAAREDLMAGFTAERDMGTEGAGSASTAVRDAIDAGLIPGPRMRMSGNAIDILGGHEDAIGYNPAAKVPSNADYADSADDLVRVMRQQHKEGSDFAKIYETGPDVLEDGVLTTPYQYTEAELRGRWWRKLGSVDRWGLACIARASRERGSRWRQASRRSTMRIS